MKNLKKEHRYLLLKKDILGMELPSDILPVNIPARIPIVRDNYGDKINFGLHREDSENAYYHALYTFYTYENLQTKRNYTRARLRKQMLQDFKNYIYCEAMEKGDNKEVRTEQLLRIMWHMEMFEEIIQVVLKNNEHFRREFEETWQKDEEFYWIVALDQKRLFTAFGDEQIWRYRNPELALKFYELTQLDWKEEEVEWGGADFEEKEGKCGAEVISLSSYLACKNLVDSAEETVDSCEFTETFFESEKEKKCWEIYGQICEELKWQPDCERVTELTDSLIDWCLDIGTTELKTNRMLGFLLLVVEKRCLFWNLLCLAGDTEEKIESLNQRAMKAIVRNEDKRFIAIKHFIARGKDREKLFQDCLYLLQIQKQAMDIADELRIRQLDSDIAYYTSLETFGYMLPESRDDTADKGKFSIMNIAYMNDPNEGKNFMQYVRRGDLAAGKRKKEGLRRSVKYPYVFMKCFTSGIDDLPMWEMYGDHAKGCCIVLDRTCLWPEVLGRQLPVYRVCYIKKNASGYRINSKDNPKVNVKRIMYCAEQIRGLMRMIDKKIVGEEILEELVGDIVYLFKDAAYQHEQEVRIFYRYNEASDDFRHTADEMPLLYVMPDIPVKIKEIILGPKCAEIERKMPYLQERVEWLCGMNDFKMPLMTKSAVEYK